MTTIQKIIRIGSSKGVTLPAKQLKQLGVDTGDEVRITVESTSKAAPHQNLMNEYKKFTDKYDETLKNLADRQFLVFKYLSLEEILRLHFQVISDYGGSYGVRDEGRLSSVVDSPALEVFGVEQYEGVYRKAAVYMRNIIADHPFFDGNKRTGTTVAAIFLIRNKVELTATPSDLENFAVSVATDHLDVEAITVWLEEHTK